MSNFNESLTSVNRWFVDGIREAADGWPEDAKVVIVHKFESTDLGLFEIQVLKIDWNKKRWNVSVRCFTDPNDELEEASLSSRPDLCQKGQTRWYRYWVWQYLLHRVHGSDSTNIWSHSRCQDCEFSSYLWYWRHWWVQRCVFEWQNLIIPEFW